ncbi:MAG: ferredoxin [Bdellovibrionales bacterium]|nr:ferredoxin [Bdellovibrionales bacterium]
MQTFGSLFIAIFVAVILLGGPFTLFALIKLLNSAFGSLKASFVKLTPKEAGDPTLGLLVAWDSESFEEEIFRVKVDYTELVRGGRSASFSFTFEGKGAKKRSFLIPMQLDEHDFRVLTDNGISEVGNSVSRSEIQIELENNRGETVRFTLPKSQVLKAMRGLAYVAPAGEVEVLPARKPDDWSLQTRVFPWKVAVAAAETTTEKAAPKPKAAGGAPTIVDFIVTKVWIEPGCIVCDACENEAPAVFQVLADTCIVRENAPLTDAGSIAAAAEGCPVDVIKYTKAPKPA